MATIVTVDAGDKGRLLCDLWSRIGGHSTSDNTEDLEEGCVIVFGGSPNEAPSRLGSLEAGTIIVDCGDPTDTNALRSSPSGAERLAQMYPEARIVKALNGISVHALALVSRHPGPEVGTMYFSAFYCGDDDEAKRVVAGLMGEINLDAIDCGPLSQAVLLESLGLLERYLTANASGEAFAISAVRQPRDRSPLDRWM